MFKFLPLQVQAQSSLEAWPMAVNHARENTAELRLGGSDIGSGTVDQGADLASRT